MNLTLADLDPDVAQRLADNPRFARLHTANTPKGAPTKAARDKVMLRLRFNILSLAVASAGVIVYLVVTGQTHVATARFAGATAVLTLSILLLGEFWRDMKSVIAASNIVPAQTGATHQETPLALADLRDASRFLFGLHRSSQMYLEAVIALWEAEENETLPEIEARDLLRQMNGLLESDRALGAQEARLARLGGDAETARLANERDALAVRAGQAADPAARDAFAQSVTLCDARLAQAREVAPLRERVAAQREVLAQTLASLHDAILRLGVAPAAASLTLPGEMERARDAAFRIAAQSRAVEAAVQEVMADQDRPSAPR